MQETPTPRFITFEVTILAIESLRPLVDEVRRVDRDLADQMRRAGTSICLNTAEGNRSQGGNRAARFSNAAGSTSEVRAALRVAVAWGYVTPEAIAASEALLDRVAAMLHRLGARRLRGRA